MNSFTASGVIVVVCFDQIFFDEEDGTKISCYFGENKITLRLFIGIETAYVNTGP